MTQPNTYPMLDERAKIVRSQKSQIFSVLVWNESFPQNALRLSFMPTHP